MGRIIDELGNRHGRLLVIEHVPDNRPGAYWLCKCDCGNEKILLGTQLRYGSVRSCGCYQKELMSKIHYKLPKGEAAFNSLYASYKKNAKKRSYMWELSKEQFRKLSQMSCTYCGIEPHTECNYAEYNDSFTYNGIDRKNSVKGYTIDNTVPCCSRCNFMKNRLSTQEFLEHISRIYLFTQESCL